MARGRHDGVGHNPVSLLGEALFRRRLEEDGHGPAITFARLCTSRHLVDLQWIAFLVFLTLFVVFGCNLGEHIHVYTGSFTRRKGELPLFALPGGRHVLFELFHGSSVAIGGGFLAASAGILNWIYQSGSRRIGTVDLFACELTVLCRVLLVSNFAVSTSARADGLCVAAAAGKPGDPPPTIPKFASDEAYTPVYDGELSELAPLDVDVITNVTQFYTYRKTMADYMRAMGYAPSLDAVASFARRTIYMQFLMYESARLAISALVEFEPARSEALVNILCSELTVYAFLYGHYGDDDYRGQRLRLRCEEYREIVIAMLTRLKEKETHRAWARARTTARELRNRYEQMCQATALAPEIPIELQDL